MPLASDEATEDTSDDLLLRILIWGPEKTKKTWWACKAAEAGFNVILLDSDDGAQILTQIASTAKQRIAHILCKDKLNEATAAEFLTRFFRGKEFIWDETDRKILVTTITRNKSHRFVRVNPNKLTKNDIVVGDSWTSTVLSLANRWNIENGRDITDNVSAIESDWPGYRWTGMVASQWLKQMKALPCHFFMIGHQTVYEKYKVTGSGDSKSRELEWVKKQIISTSKPHSMTIGKDFSDILNFRMYKNLFKISSETHEESIGGARVVAPGEYNWADLQFVDICRSAKIYIPENRGKFNSEAFIFYEPGAEFPEDAEGKKTLSMLQKNKAGQIEVNKPATASLSGLLTKGI